MCFSQIQFIWTLLSVELMLNHLQLNLASQSVLEGLNAVLDHRGELYIPELGRTFTLNSLKTRLFACQNPLRQGGARKGLPASFLNRFTQVGIQLEIKRSRISLSDYLLVFARRFIWNH